MPQFKATLLRPNGPPWSRVFEEEPTLEWLQENVGGYIEIVHALLPLKVYVDEDGISKRLAVNPEATARFGHVTESGQIVGNVVVVEPLQ